VRRVSSPGKQTEKRAQIEASVLRATEALLEEGATFAELGIERIATRAGISRTAFYFYFRDKRDLLVRLTEEVNSQLMVAADGWWTGEQDVRAALERVGEIYREHGLLLRAVVEVSTYDEEVATFWRGQVGRFVEATRDRIRAEQEAGRALEGNADATAFALIWMTERTFYQQRVQSPPAVPGDIETLVEALAGIFTRAVYGG
jgi:TetR/AcrR family transcriptional regulator, ethionamide resistance regulator